MSSLFSDQVGRFVAKSTGRMEAVYRQSAQDVIEEAQTVRASGGNLPVDTGFLRSTGGAALDVVPSGLTEAPEGETVFSWDSEAALAVIAKAKLGDTIFFGYSANYAVYMEARYGFVKLAAQNWPQIVKRNAERLRKRVSK